MIAKMGKNINDRTILVTEMFMKKMKEQIRVAAKRQIELWIYEGCSKLKLHIGDGIEQQQVTSFKDLEKLFGSDNSRENFSKIWFVLIGQFETCEGDPFQEFENSYMEQKKWKYSKTESDKNLKSGFIEKLIKQQKREKIKLLNIVGAKTHGYTMGISRDGSTITEENKYKKRKKGVFEDYMIKKIKVSNIIEHC